MGQFVEVTLDVIGQTPLAYHVTDGDRDLFLPRSQVGEITVLRGSLDAANEDEPATVEIKVKEWLAAEEGLI